ncbi:hypothetical protein [Pseudonocardia acidicola]|uniref:Uncharacterized protein n=1 Tax=Pseudonocardia acidicola TaxID=2724939 RepID=A0ABX1SBL1_9PSEU|nr:hypothetical protein [Pseudonocardia acidicola]NMH98197.1 hypothetical protein [Pseudonocardia acidicola]
MPLFGDFDHRVVVGSFTPDPERMQVDQEQHGLGLQATWLYGFFHDEDGLTYCCERKFVGSLTSGCFVMTQNGDPSRELDVHPDSGRSARGELRRVLGGVERKWSDPVFQRLPKGTLPEGEQPMTLHWTGDRLTYDEGDILQLEGESAGNGVQFFVPSRKLPLLYTSTCYWMTGEFQGKRVQGPIWFDNGYWRHGMEWKEYGYFNDLQIMWGVFCNKFADGGYEWGHLVMGREGFTPGVVVEGDQVAAMTPTLDARFDMDGDDWPNSATYDVAGTQYEFVGPQTGRMTEFSESRWANYRAQYGQIRRIGDERELVDGLTWLEGFGNRVTEDGLRK